MGVLSSSSQPSPAVTAATRREPWGLLPPALFAGAMLLYGMTAAPGTVFGDPSEYQFIPAIWGIAHPPGYAFYTLLTGVWQRLVAVGSIAYRTNLLAAVAGAWAVSRMVAITLRVLRAGKGGEGLPSGLWTAVVATITGVSVALMPDLWQHSIHANAHILSAAITSTQLWLLVRWQEADEVGWLIALAFMVGIGVTHHPITVWGIPAYLVYILLHRPRIISEVKMIAGGVLAAAAGLSPWLYFPLRSPQTPFGPTDMHTLDGFLRHATAQGLRVNLFHFGLADQVDRLRVFVTLLQLQYGWLLIAVMMLGIVSLIATRPRFGVLWCGFLLGHLAFTMNSVQDVMAYLLHPLVALGLPLGLGVAACLRSLGALGRWGRFAGSVTLALVLCVRGYGLLPKISLRTWHDADAFVAELRERFAGRGEGAALVSDWEHLTPFFYVTLAEGKPFDSEDLRPVYVTGATPWVESVMGNLASGPVYLTNYRRDVRQLGFRLRPEGSLWRVLEPPALDAGAPQVALHAAWDDGQLEMLGYDLADRRVQQGATLPLTLYARVPVSTWEILMPVADLGTVEQAWTTDSRRLTPEWRPGEVIVEQYLLHVPFDLPPGEYPLDLRYDALGDGRRPLLLSDGSIRLSLGTIEIIEAKAARRASATVGRALTNLGNQVALVSARARAGLRTRSGVWQQPLRVRAGQPLHLDLTWQALARPETSYTVFIHVMDAEGNLWLGHDYTPLGGAFPSYLWFPKWLAGQRITDPYRLVLRSDMPEGLYTLEVGMYEMGSVRRIAQLSVDGMMIGDRLILGHLQVIR